MLSIELVTSINASYGPNGVTTQYTFRTFTPRFGVPSRFIIERMKKQTIKQNEDRRNILKAYMDETVEEDVVEEIKEQVLEPPPVTQKQAIFEGKEEKISVN